MIFVYDTQDETIRLACSSGYWNASGMPSHIWQEFYRQQEDGIPYAAYPSSAYLVGEAIGRSEVPKDNVLAVVFAAQGIGVACDNGVEGVFDFSSKEGASGDCWKEAVALLDLGLPPEQVVQTLINQRVHLKVFGRVLTMKFPLRELPEWKGALCPIGGLE